MEKKINSERDEKAWAMTLLLLRLEEQGISGQRNREDELFLRMKDESFYILLLFKYTHDFFISLSHLKITYCSNGSALLL